MTGRKLGLVAGGVIVLVVAGGVLAAHSRFTDVTDDHPVDAIEWAVEQGITAGYSATEFRPDEPLKRSHALVFLTRFYDNVLGANGDDQFANPDFTRADMMALLHSMTAPTQSTWISFEGEGVDGEYYGYSIDAISYSNSDLFFAPTLYLRCGKDNPTYNDIFIGTPWHLPADEDGLVIMRSRFSHQDEPTIGIIFSDEDSGSGLFANFDSGTLKIGFQDLNDEPTKWFIEIIDNLNNRKYATFELSHTATAISTLACFN